jgi:hypothetical protein
MPTLRFILNGQEVEATLTMDEFIQLFSTGTKRRSPVQISSGPEQIAGLVKAQMEKKNVAKMLEQELHPNDEVKQYILSNAPQYRHTLFDVQTHFYGREFISRGPTKKMYHKTFRQLQLIRQEIEREQKGKFVTEVGDNRINQYVFQKTQQTATLREPINL